MSATVEDLLERLNRGEVAIANGCAQIVRLALGDPRGADGIARRLDSYIQSGQVAPEIGQPLLDALSGMLSRQYADTRHATPTVQETRLRDPEPPAALSTLLRPAPVPMEQAPGTAHRVSGPPDVPVLRSQARDLVAGSLLKDRFLLEASIGKGGMGIVFSALDRRKEEALDPHPHVAIKILNAAFRDHPQALKALQREAAKAQSLAHPNVATVFDFDRDGSTLFITMELLHGRSLDAVVRDARAGGIGRSAALPIIHGIADGLAYAHRKGIVHSDLKPGNVFLVDDGTPKILDFGIARAIPSMQTEVDRKDVFDAGSLGAYTEAYATPEMVVGSEPHPADDLYALGLIAYELLTGRHPYQGLGASKARERSLKPAPIKALKRREWKALERCLAFEVASRPRDAAEFIRLFFGVSTLTKTLMAAAVVVLAIASGYLWYANYEEAGPMVPLSALPEATQQQVHSLLSEGETEWGFYQSQKNPMQLWSAIDRYAEAYRLHPRNRDAVKGLKQVANAILSVPDIDPQTRREAAAALEQRSDYLSRYKPVVDAAGGN